MRGDRRGLRGKSKVDANDRAYEHAKAERARAEGVEANLGASIDTVDESLDDFRNRDAGFATAGHSHTLAEIGTGAASATHQHGADAINAVHWRNVGTADSKVPDFSLQGHTHDGRYLNEGGKHSNNNHDPKFAAAGHNHSISFKDLPVRTREAIADTRVTMALDKAWFDNNGGTWFGGRTTPQVIRTLLQSMLHVYHMVGDTPEYTMQDQNDILEVNPNFNFEQWEAQELPGDPTAKFYNEDDPALT